MNKFVIGMFFFMVILCLTASIYSACWDVLFQADTPYLRWDVDDLLESNNFWYKLLLSFGNWILIFVDFVPISLLVTMEGVKFWQAYLISSDHYLFDENLNQTAKAQSSNLNEELG